MGWTWRVSLSLVFELWAAGVESCLDNDVRLETMPRWDGKDARSIRVGKILTPELFNRYINGWLPRTFCASHQRKQLVLPEYASNACIQPRLSLAAFALTAELYPYWQGGSVLLKEGEMTTPPCGALFDIPFWRHGEGRELPW